MVINSINSLYLIYYLFKPIIMKKLLLPLWGSQPRKLSINFASSVATFAVAVLFLSMSPFNTSLTPVHKFSPQKANVKLLLFDGGYFTQNGQEYHVYTDDSKNIVAMYKTVAEGPDGDALTTFTGHEYDGTPPLVLKVYVNYTDGGSQFYNGTVYY